MSDNINIELSDNDDLTLTLQGVGGGSGGPAVWGQIAGNLGNQADLAAALAAKANASDLPDAISDYVTAHRDELKGDAGETGPQGPEGPQGPAGPSVWGGISGSLANQTDLQTALNAKANASALANIATSGDYNDLIHKPTIPSLTGYATENWVNNQGFLKEHQSLSGYATRSWVTERGYLTATALTDYVKTSDLSTAINGVKTWVQNQNYLTAHQSLANYYTKTEIDAKGYLTEHQSLSGYATQAWVGQQGYLTLETAPPIKTVNGQSLIGTGNVEISGVDEVYVGAVEPDPSEGYKLWVDTSSEDTGIAQLWQNEDAISGAYTFAAQTISLNLSAFKAVYVDFLVKAGYSSHVCQMCIKGLTDRIFVGAYSAEVKFYDRIVKPTNSGVEFLDAASNGDTDNTVCVPYRIYGVR